LDGARGPKRSRGGRPAAPWDNENVPASTPSPSPGYGAGDASHFRASDAEREATAEVLRAHFADGRLDATEFAERLERAYKAKTRADLSALCHDLPPLPPPPPLPEPPPPRPVRRGSPVLAAALRWAVLDLGAVGLWALGGVHQSFWPEWVILVSAFVVGRRAARELEQPRSDARR
jgi:hypothetical protein